MSIAKADELILVSNGAYSDYGVMGLVRVLVDFDTVEIRDKFISEIGPLREYENNEDRFYGYLVDNGYVENIEVRELYIGSYGKIDEDFSLKYRYSPWRTHNVPCDKCGVNLRWWDDTVHHYKDGRKIVWCRLCTPPEDDEIFN